MTRRQALVIRGFCLWTFVIWVVFVRNVVIGGDSAAGARIAHGVLAVVSFLLAGWSLRVVSEVREHAARG